MDVIRALFERTICLELPHKKMKVSYPYKYYIFFYILFSYMIHLLISPHGICSSCLKNIMHSRSPKVIKTEWSMLSQRQWNLLKTPVLKVYSQLVYQKSSIILQPSLIYRQTSPVLSQKRQFNCFWKFCIYTEIDVRKPEI